MPEPPKITTSLADRIARLNATRQAYDRNHATEKKEIGEIKSKISKYEATGQHEAPLIPKGSFGLGAPLTKPERGLDRIRIASSGVSGGTTVSNSIKPISAPSSNRSLSLGHPPSNRLSSASVELSTRETRSTPPSSSINHSRSTSHSPIPCSTLDSPSSSSILNQPLTPQHQPHQPSGSSQLPPTESNQAYDGILDGYPTTPATEDGPPLVTCSNCLATVELEALADHLCQLSVNHADSNRSDHDPSIDESREEFPVDVPESPVREDQPSEPSNEKSKVILETTNSPSVLVIKEDESEKKSDQPIESKTSIQSDHDSSTKTGTDDNKSKNGNSDSSSDSTNTTNATSATSRLSGSNRPDFRGSSPSYRTWHDDEDDDDYADSNGATGFVTIVRSGSRI